MARKVRDIMSTAPVCMASTESVSAAAQAMRRHGTGTVLVVAGGQISGLLTDRDITVSVLAEDRDPLTTRVSDICGAAPAVLSPDNDVAQAAWLLHERGVRRIPVLADGVPVGVVSAGDLVLGANPAGDQVLDADLGPVLSGASASC